MARFILIYHHGAEIDYGFAQTTDSEGNLYVWGWTNGSLGRPNLAVRDAWLAKFDSNGNQLWSKQFGTAGIESAWSIA